MIIKNRNRQNYSFANINLLGKCNVDCFFCLGKDIEKELSKHNQLNKHFSGWKNFNEFIEICKNNNIEKIYLTGQNTDALMYKYFEELRDFIQSEEFLFGIRTNGYLLDSKIREVNKCNNTIGVSIHTLNESNNHKIMNKMFIPDWKTILPKINNCRVSIVVNRYNQYEFLDIVKFVSNFPNVKYIQARRISTDTRYDELRPDIEAYENLYNHIKSNFIQTGEYYLAQQFYIYGKEVDFWRTVETSVNSINYFTDGTLSDEYFVVEGYLKSARQEAEHNV